MNKQILFILTVGLFNSCSEKENQIVPDNNIGNSTVSDNLHLAFKTPDWERNIDCTLLDLYPAPVNDSTNTVSATSQSTHETFFFTFPTDSSEMVKPGNLKKYKIMNVYENTQPFQFSQKLPLDENSPDTYAKRLVSIEGFSETEYNQLVEIKYLQSELKYAVFRIKCKFEMKTFMPATPEIIKPVSGTFTFKIRTNKI